LEPAASADVEADMSFDKSSPGLLCSDRQTSFSKVTEVDPLVKTKMQYRLDGAMRWCTYALSLG